MMKTKPIIHVHYINDDYKNRPECAVFDKYLIATPGKIFEKLGGFDTLEIISVSEYKIVLELDGKTETLRQGEAIDMKYELPGLIADGSGWEYFTATIRWLTDDEAAHVTAEQINGRYLVMTWDYKYDKESTWFDEDSGENYYALKVGASYALPHISDISLEIRSVTSEGDLVKAKIYVDQTYTVCNNGESVTAYAYDDYMVAGDSVSQTLRMEFTVK